MFAPVFQLRITEGDFSRAVRRLADGAESVFLPLGVNQHAEGIELIARPPYAALSDRESVGQMRLAFDAGGDAAFNKDIEWASDGERSRFRVGLYLGEETARGVVRQPGGKGLVRLHGVQVVGAGMPYDCLSPRPRDIYDMLTQRWDTERRDSRWIGVVGETAYEKLRNIKIAVIGAGGLGSVFAETIARMSDQEGHLTLIDPDRLEWENLAAWTIASEGAELGSSKVDALAAHLRQITLAPTLETIPHTVEHVAALAALKRSDLWVCCVDNSAARGACGLLAARYSRPLLVVETGVFLGSGPETHALQIGKESPLRTNNLPVTLLADGARVFQADIRLVLPGGGSNAAAAGCLFCTGEAEEATTIEMNDEPFWRLRAGTLYALNMETVGVAVQTLLGFLSGHITDTLHWQRDGGSGRLPEWKRVGHPARIGCAVCRCTGSGDAPE